MKKVLIAGTFDILHPGHINLIKQAKEFGDFLVAVIGRDENVMKTKGRKPYFNENERVKNLEKLGLIDKVILGDLDDPYKIIKEERPDVIALGYDQHTYVRGLHDLICNSDLSSSIEVMKPFKEDICKGKNVRNAIEDSGAGFLLVNKDDEWTSHDVVAKLRSIADIKQVGHTGTLDPFATGLLICAIGKATKLVGMFSAKGGPASGGDVLSKVYEATVKLGVVSDTFDRTGQISNSQPPTPKKISTSNLQTVLESFVGKQKQIPPMYSAKKVGGQKLYKLARRGQEVERKSSEIEIYKIENLKLKTENLIFTIKVTCSTGTYIRTLAHDIGQKLETGAILEELKRTAIGSFRIEDSVRLDQLTKDNYSKYLIKPLEALDRINSEYLKPTAS